MKTIDVYKNGEFKRYKNVLSVVLQKSGILEFFYEDGTIIMFQPEEYDWFCVL